jgi:hypothetical protein
MASEREAVRGPPQITPVARITKFASPSFGLIDLRVDDVTDPRARRSAWWGVDVAGQTYIRYYRVTPAAFAWLRRFAGMIGKWEADGTITAVEAEARRAGWDALRMWAAENLDGAAVKNAIATGGKFPSDVAPEYQLRISWVDDDGVRYYFVPRRLSDWSSIIHEWVNEDGLQAHVEGWRAAHWVVDWKL